MATNPEQTAAEIFVGNTKHVAGTTPHLATLKTARLGAVAYDLDGHELDPSYMRPLFVGRSEADDYDRIMMARFSAIRRG